MTHPALTRNSLAVITGAASGIGLAAAKSFAQMGMRLMLVDVNKDKLEAAYRAVLGCGALDVATFVADVSQREAVDTLARDILDTHGVPSILMNNAGIGRSSTCLGTTEDWDALLGVNFNGALYGTQAFAHAMIASGKPGAIINTGSKQGITTPPGNPAYNVSKAALKAYTEALAHELRNTEGCAVTAHLLIPGFVHTGITGVAEKPPAAWTAEQTVEFFLDSLNRGDFYILCPDNDVDRALDEKRMAWAMGDIIENRPALSRWHPDYAEAFAKYIAEG